jgi:hypothetical protein
MKTQSQESISLSTPAICNTHTSLYRLVNRLQDGRLQRDADKKTVITRDVDETLPISGDEDTLALIIEGLQTNALYYTSGCCVRLETVRIDDDCRQLPGGNIKSMNIIFSKASENAA